MREEAVPVKKSFNKLLTENCVAIPTNGYYEWATEEFTGNKNKYRFYEKGEDTLYIAGLYRTFYNRGWSIRERFIILTTKANTSAKTYHDRMPVLLKKDEIADWVSGRDPMAYLSREPFAVESELTIADTGEMNTVNSL